MEGLGADMFNAGSLPRDYWDNVPEKSRALHDVAEAIGGQAWGLDVGKPRVYVPSPVATRSWFEFPDYTPADIGIPKLGIYVNMAWFPSGDVLAKKRDIRARLARTAVAIVAWRATKNRDIVSAVRSVDATMDELRQAWTLFSEFQSDDAVRLLRIEKATTWRAAAWGKLKRGCDWATYRR